MQGRKQSRTHLALQYMCDAKKQSMQRAVEDSLTAQREEKEDASSCRSCLKYILLLALPKCMGPKHIQLIWNTAGL